MIIWNNVKYTLNFISKRLKIIFCQVKLILIQLSGIGIFETFKVMSGKQIKKARTPIWYQLSRILFYLFIITSFIRIEIINNFVF